VFSAERPAARTTVDAFSDLSAVQRDFGINEPDHDRTQ